MLYSLEEFILQIFPLEIHIFMGGGVSAPMINTSFKCIIYLFKICIGI